MSFIPAQLIKKKREGQSLTKEEINFFINGFIAKNIPDYAMSSLLMSIFFKGMSPEETLDLTNTMIDSGASLIFDLSRPTVDKHSTGGVGDKASLILGPIAAAAGVPIPMMAGRGLGHTGGTIDKLESIPGFKTNLTLDQFQKQVKKIGIAMIAQNNEICPADKSIYALRDVTATVESLPLICASIMSKKIAEGAKNLVLDVKYGSGAFMKTLEQAEELAKGLMSIGKLRGMKIHALLTSMEQPLGHFIGNVLEIRETLCILKNESFDYIEAKELKDTANLSINLAAHMIYLAGIASSVEESLIIAQEQLSSGKAYEKFEEMVKAQGGNLSKLADSHQKFIVTSDKKGFISGFDTEAIGWASISLGAGRKIQTDIIDHNAGIKVHKKIGDKVEKDEPLFTLYASDPNKFHESKTNLLEATYFSKKPVQSPKLITKILMD